VIRTYFVLICSLCLVAGMLTSCASGGATGPQAGITATPTTRLSNEAQSSVAHTWDDWLAYHHDVTHGGYLPSTPDPQHLTNAWATSLNGAVYAEPLMVKGHLIVVTEGDTLYSLDPQSGKVIWQTNVGTPVPQSSLPCGDIDPLGITGTPVYDPATGLVFAVAEISGPQHILVGVDASTGKVQLRRTVDVDGMDSSAHQQRAALTLSQGMVYIAYGGLAGDCSDYRGTVVASRTNGQGDLFSFRVPTPREGGIWGPSGPAIDAAGNVYVSVGNGAETQGAWDHSDSVLRLSPQLQLEDGFAPANWKAENSSDADLGSIGPVLLPDGLVFVAGKDGMGYVLHANALGGVGGQVAEAKICDGQAMGGATLIGSQVLVPCTDGVRLITIQPNGQISIGWHSSEMKMPVIVGGHTVYGLNTNGTLFAADLSNGQVRTSVNMSVAVPTFSTPTLSGRSVFFGTTNGVAAATFS
jgi:outer membrane protein assembly factor BamB